MSSENPDLNLSTEHIIPSDDDESGDSGVSVSNYRFLYEQERNRRRTLMKLAQKATRDYDDLKERYKEATANIDVLQAKLEETENQLRKLQKVSEAVYHEYDDLKTRYESESESMSHAFTQATEWYKENKSLRRETAALRRQSALFMQKVNKEELELEEDFDNMDKMSDLDKSHESEEETLMFLHKIKDLELEVGKLNSDLTKAHEEEFAAQEEILSLRVQLEESQATIFDLKERVDELEYVEKSLHSTSSHLVKELEQLKTKLRAEASKTESALSNAAQARRAHAVLKRQSAIIFADLPNEEKFRKSLEEIQDLTTSLLKGKESHEARVQQLQRDLEDLRCRKDDNEIIVLEEKVSLLEDEIQHYRKSEKSANKRISSLEDEVNRLTQQLSAKCMRKANEENINSTHRNITYLKPKIEICNKDLHNTSDLDESFSSTTTQSSESRSRPQSGDECPPPAPPPPPIYSGAPLAPPPPPIYNGAKCAPPPPPPPPPSPMYGTIPPPPQPAPLSTNSLSQQLQKIHLKKTGENDSADNLKHPSMGDLIDQIKKGIQLKQTPSRKNVRNPIRDEIVQNPVVEMKTILAAMKKTRSNKVTLDEPIESQMDESEQKFDELNSKNDLKECEFSKELNSCTKTGRLVDQANEDAKNISYSVNTARDKNDSNVRKNSSLNGSNDSYLSNRQNVYNGEVMKNGTLNDTVSLNGNYYSYQKPVNRSQSEFTNEIMKQDRVTGYNSTPIKNEKIVGCFDRSDKKNFSNPNIYSFSNDSSTLNNIDRSPISSDRSYIHSDTNSVYSDKIPVNSYQKIANLKFTPNKVNTLSVPSRGNKPNVVAPPVSPKPYSKCSTVNLSEINKIKSEPITPKKYSFSHTTPLESYQGKVENGSSKSFYSQPNKVVNSNISSKIKALEGNNNKVVSSTTIFLTPSTDRTKIA